MPSPLIYPKFQGIAPNPIGAAAAGYKLKTFAAGTSNPLATFTDSTLLVANPTTIIMDANGEANVWLGALAYKFVFTDPADVVQWTADNVTQAGVGFGGGTTGAVGAEWIPLPPPTFIGTTSFSVGGGVTDLSATPYFLTQGSRVRTQNSGGVIYSTVLTVSGNVLSVKNDSGVLDAGLSAAWYGIVSTMNSLAVRTMISYWGGANVNLANAAAVAINSGGTVVVDKLAETSATAQVTVKQAGSYRIWGTVLFNELGATNGITLAAQSVQVRKNGVNAIGLTINWPFANLTIATMAIPFNGVVVLAVNDFIDVAVLANFTGTPPTANLSSFQMERIL